ncbi:MbeB family mobilization protein [Salmonella enterica]|uniref:MbeB family mobilization protein n=1 Tax=Klebsiella oxytoca TaxID=571 RepID=UPI0018C6AE1A|nr:MbeB family mobilization protein [Klebsiella oxytoca]EJJ0143925.1 MbeB family mobilization protein [Salmonella enterica]EJJ0339552.1 MbeB family mobilization protein [Salmonella enterica]EJJ0348504.1 MbeB family mobilization protein [Salmonella enterica]EJJ4267087.1 MbeB family mobilization protein [Salmonella enterica]MBG2708987.1 MbeB family mobilization protein [Klebsiella oxytoca]
MSSLLTLAKDLEQKSKEQQETTGEMLKAAFSEHEKSVKEELSASAKRINAAISDHDQKLASAMNLRTKGMVRMVSQTWLTIVLVSVLLIASSGGILWWQGEQIRDHYTLISEMKRTEAMLSKRNNGVRLSVCGDSKRPCVKVNPEAGTFGEGKDSGWMVLAGK